MREQMIESILSYRQKDGVIKTAIPSLYLFTHETSTEYIPIVYEPSLCIALQGHKELYLGDEHYVYDKSKYLLASIHIPARVRVVVEDKPYVALKIVFSMRDILEVLKEYKPKDKQVQGRHKHGLCISTMDDKLLEPIFRLVKLLENPTSIDFLAPLIVKEILYNIVSGDGGEFLREYALDGSVVQQIVKIINKINKNFTQPINMGELAKNFGMSESSLYHSFKKITTMSPLQIGRAHV